MIKRNPGDCYSIPLLMCTVVALCPKLLLWYASPWLRSMLILVKRPRCLTVEFPVYRVARRMSSLYIFYYESTRIFVPCSRIQQIVLELKSYLSYLSAFWVRQTSPDAIFTIRSVYSWCEVRMRNCSIERYLQFVVSVLSFLGLVLSL